MFGIFPKMCHLDEDYYTSFDKHEFIVDERHISKIILRREQIIQEVLADVDRITPELYTYWSDSKNQLDYSEFVKSIKDKKEVYALPICANTKSMHKIVDRIHLLYLKLNAKTIDMDIYAEAIFNLSDFDRPHVIKHGFDLSKTKKWLAENKYSFPTYISTNGYKTINPTGISLVNKDKQKAFIKPFPHSSSNDNKGAFSICTGGYGGVIESILKKYPDLSIEQKQMAYWKILLTYLEYVGRFNPTDPYGSYYYEFVPKDFRPKHKTCDKCGGIIREGDDQYAVRIGGVTANVCSQCFYVSKCVICGLYVTMEHINNDTAYNGADYETDIYAHKTCMTSQGMPYTSKCQICNEYVFKDNAIILQDAGELTGFICTDCADNALPTLNEPYTLTTIRNI